MRYSDDETADTAPLTWRFWATTASYIGALACAVVLALFTLDRLGLLALH